MFDDRKPLAARWLGRDSGLDREAANQEFAEFLGDRNLTASQIEFISLIIDYLTQNGMMDPALLYESPFTDLSPRGPAGLFSDHQVNRLVAVLEEIRRRAG